MNYIYLIITVILISSQNVTSKECMKRNPGVNVYIYSAVLTFTALLFFVVNSKFKLSFEPAVIPYSVGFAVSYATSLAGNVMAIRKGPLSLTSLVLSYSLIIPTLYGIFFLGNKPTLFSYVGIVLLLISLYMINIKDEDMKFTPSWIFFVVLSFVGNGMCSTIQTIQQRVFEKAYKNEFMVVALAVVVIILLVAGIFGTKDKKDRKTFTDCLPYAPIQGLVNGIVNYFVMVLTSLIAPAIMFPTISAGGIVCTFILSVTVYKEKLTKPQLVGYAIGVMSIILLNI